MEPDHRQQAFLFSNIAAQLRGALSNLHLAAAQLVPAEAREQDPELDARAALLDQSYWVLGSVLGSLAGSALGFDTTGVDFAMTALFLVIAVGQWKAAGSHLPALLGICATLVSLLLVGEEEMLLPALGVIVLVLVLLRPRLDKQNSRAETPEEKEAAS